MPHSEKYDVDRIFRLIISLLMAALFFALIYYLRNILIPFVIAFIIAYLLDPVVDAYEKLHIPRVIAILIVFMILGCILFSIVFGVFPYIFRELEVFSSVFPTYIHELYTFVQSKIAYFSKNAASSEFIESYVTTIIQNIEASQVVEQLLTYIANIFSQLLNIIYLLVAFVIIIMYVFFLLRDIDRIREKWEYFIPVQYRETARTFLQETYYYIANFFRGQLTIVIILGILFSIGFSIVDIRLSILIGFTAGFLNLIPNFGTLIAIFPAVLLAVGRAAENESDPLWFIGKVLIVFLVVQIIQDTVLVPKVMGKRTGLRPATILFSVLIWGKLLGFLGVILAIPLTCLTKVYFARFVLKEEKLPVSSEK